MKDLTAAAAVGITIFGTVPYLVATLRGRIRPHAVTWLIWTATTSIAFVGQVLGGGGAGTLPSASTAGIGGLIAGYALWRGDRSYNLLDAACLAGTVLALLGWALASSPLVALILIALIDVIGAAPTIRKAYFRPWEEGVSAFLLANLKWLLTLFALDSVNVLTVLFPLTTSAVNTTIIAVVLVRRSQGARSSGSATVRLGS